MTLEDMDTKEFSKYIKFIKKKLKKIIKEERNIDVKLADILYQGIKMDQSSIRYSFKYNGTFTDGTLLNPTTFDEFVKNNK